MGSFFLIQKGPFPSELAPAAPKGPRRPQRAPNGPRAPAAPEGPRRPQKAPNGPRRALPAPGRPQRAPEGPRWPQRAPEGLGSFPLCFRSQKGPLVSCSTMALFHLDGPQCLEGPGRPQPFVFRWGVFYSDPKRQVSLGRAQAGSEGPRRA